VKSLDKPGDKSWVGEAEGKALKIISFLLQDLPSAYNYKIIFLQRSLPEVLASQQKMLERRGEVSGEVSNEDMAKMFEAHLVKIENWLSQQQNFEVLYVDHRDTLSNPITVAASINEFLGGQLDTNAMAAVVDPNLYRNRA